MMIKGIIPAMPTPMRNDGSLDTEAIQPLVEALIRNGADGIFSVGSMGEAASLDMGERLRIIKATVHAADGRVPVIAGCGFITTEETVFATKSCEDIGVTAVSVISPFYWKLTQDDLFAHYAQIIRQTSMPVFAYNLPNNTGLNILPETIGRLFHEEGLCGAKDSSGVWENSRGYMDQTGEGFTMLIGDDALCLEGLKYGSQGSISAPGNVYTFVMKAIYNRFLVGDLVGAQHAQDDWNRILSKLGGIGGFPANYKLATDKLVAVVGPPRRPVSPVNISHLEAILDDVEQIASRYR